MIHMQERHKKIVMDILAQYHYIFYAFGSRVTGKVKKFSDLDLCFFDNIPWNIRSHIEEDFDESDLPYTVDLVNWNLCTDSFKSAIKKHLIQISQK